MKEKYKKFSSNFKQHVTLFRKIPTHGEGEAIRAEREKHDRKISYMKEIVFYKKK